MGRRKNKKQHQKQAKRSGNNSVRARAQASPPGSQSSVTTRAQASPPGNQSSVTTHVQASPPGSQSSVTTRAQASPPGSHSSVTTRVEASPAGSHVQTPFGMYSQMSPKSLEEILCPENLEKMKPSFTCHQLMQAFHDAGKNSEVVMVWAESEIENVAQPARRRQKFDCIAQALGPEPVDNERIVARTLAKKCLRKGDEEFLASDYRAAYADYLSAMKIIGEHGNNKIPFGSDTDALRECQDKCGVCLLMLSRIEKNPALCKDCYKCYRTLIKKDPIHALWYKRRAFIRFREFKAYGSAYKDFVLYAAMMKELGEILKKKDVYDTIYCYNEAAEIIWQREKQKLLFKKPFLTSDWINLWALCPCDDVLLEDLLSVREEHDDPETKSSLIESAYKDALKLISQGYHSMVVDTLLQAYDNGQGVYRAEAYLLLALIYSQDQNNMVGEFLEKFVVLWESDQHKVPVRRRKQVFMRYMSLARALLAKPCKDWNFPAIQRNASSKVAQLLAGYDCI